MSFKQSRVENAKIMMKLSASVRGAYIKQVWIFKFVFMFIRKRIGILLTNKKCKFRKF